MRRTVPYKTTPVFDETTLPRALQSSHSTKAGVWGLLRVLEGEVELVFEESHLTKMATVDSPVEIPPQAVHHVRIGGPMRMLVEFYTEPPL